MPNNNKRMNFARMSKRDEFYTDISDIESEMNRYAHSFKGKVVYCNCDDPYKSDFVKYFLINFNRLGLKKLYATCYDGGYKQLDLFEDSDIENREALKLEVDSVPNIGYYEGQNLYGEELIERCRCNVTKLEGNGDFMSDECVDILLESDIIVTNPPFSKFSDFFKQLTAYQKKFIIIGNKISVIRDEVIEEIINGNVHIDNTFKGSAGFFRSTYESLTEGHDKGLIRVPGVIWFSNVTSSKCNEPMELTAKYDKSIHKKYDDCEAIEVSKVNEIPCDYYGVMGVPITFIYKYCCCQFKIIGYTTPTLNGQKLYKRLLIRRDKDSGKRCFLYTNKIKN